MTAFDLELSSLELPTPTSNDGTIAPATVVSTKTLTPLQQIFLFSPDEWEEFTLEWGQGKKQEYHQVVRMGGANDYGVDVACFVDDQGFNGVWDNYQCKHYAKPLKPSTALPEIGKIIWHIFEKRISQPRAYYFFAPQDCGPKLEGLLTGKTSLQESLIENWKQTCQKSITSTKEIALTGELLNFVNDFDFSIFKYKSCVDVIEDHQKTRYYSTRFFQTLSARETPESPPQEPANIESRYIRQLNEAYADSKSIPVTNFRLGADLAPHYKRQRESFYSAEGLKRFARDNVPEGTFETMTDDLAFAIADIQEDTSHANGLARLKAVTSHASQLTFDANPLSRVTLIIDKTGICHQLANDGHLTWVQTDE